MSTSYGASKNQLSYLSHLLFLTPYISQRDNTTCPRSHARDGACISTWAILTHAHCIKNLDVSTFYCCLTNHSRTEWLKPIIVYLLMFVWIGSLDMFQLGQLFSAVHGLAWAYLPHLQSVSKLASWLVVYGLIHRSDCWLGLWLNCFGLLPLASSES